QYRDSTISHTDKYKSTKDSFAPSTNTEKKDLDPFDNFLISQFPPFSLGGTVRAPSLATRSKSSPFKPPRTAFSLVGRFAKGGTRLGFESTNSCSRLFHSSSISCEGATPISPG